MSMKQPFLELNRILEALRMQDLGPALEYACISFRPRERNHLICINIVAQCTFSIWLIPQTGCVSFSLQHHTQRRIWLCQCLCLIRWAVTNRQRLLDLNSSLEFKLHRLYFISLLSGGIGKQMEALQYARHFQPFASQHQRGQQMQTPRQSWCEVTPTNVSCVPADIQILMGSLVYLRHGIENSPYRSLLETNQWAEICNIFTRDACALLGLSVESPLSVRLETITIFPLVLCWCRRSVDYVDTLINQA